MSEKLIPVMSDEDIKDTLLHEIAHAIAGPTAGHGKQWVKIAELVGVKNPKATSNKGKLKPKYLGVCPNCKREVQKHRRVEIACSACCRKYNNNQYTDEYKFVWKRND